MDIALLLTAAFVAIATVESEELRFVKTSQGPVKGYKSEDGELYQFFGIPYATAPTGPYRFTAPLPGPVWMHPFEAVEKDIICPQTPLSFELNKKMQENCLIANIHVPKIYKNNLPVYVFVHGGAYLQGFGESNSPSSLARSKELIAVTFNYRLGAHGFLCLGTEDAPGNAGMKDQVALLRWVQKNIASFGGNPNNVTIAGSSAGGSSVDLLMLSEMTKGLFSKVIPESGSGLSAWSIQVDPVQTAKDFAKLQNFPEFDNVLDLQEYYKSVTLEKLVTDELIVKLDSSFHFTPCVERDIGQEMFFKEAPINILKQGKYRKVPVLYGFANMEGLFAIPYFEERKTKMNDRFSDFLPQDLQFSSEKEKDEVAEIVKEFYFGDKSIGEHTVQNYIDYFTDIMFAYGALRSTRLQVEAGSDSIYLYEYSLYSPLTQTMYPEIVKDIHGAGHAEQGLAIYDTPFSYLFGDTDAHKKMKSALREMWINFALTGKPVSNGSSLPSWPPAGSNRSPYMDLGEEIKLRGPLLEKRARFWDSIYERYSRVPVPPTPF